MRSLAVATAALLLLAVAGLGGWLALASQTSASADVWHSRGASADAAFVTMVDECLRLDTWVSAGSWVDRSPAGEPVSGSGLVVSIDLWDVCTGTWLGSVSGLTLDADVEITRRGASASGVVTLYTLCDEWGCDDYNVAVSVDWSAANAAGGASVGGWHGHDPVCNSHGSSGWREATAAGTVIPLEPPYWGPVIGRITLAAEEPDPNVIPDPAVYASVGVWQSGVVCKA